MRCDVMQSGGYYWWMYLNEGAVAVDGEYYEIKGTPSSTNNAGISTRLWGKKDEEAVEVRPEIVAGG